MNSGLGLLFLLLAHSGCCRDWWSALHLLEWFADRGTRGFRLKMGVTKLKGEDEEVLTGVGVDGC